MSKLVLFDRRQSLSKLVCGLIGEKGLTLDPCDDLRVIKNSQHSSDFIQIFCLPLPADKLDRLLSLRMENLDLGSARRQRVVREAGFVYVGQYVRTFRNLLKIKSFTKDLRTRIKGCLVEKGLTAHNRQHFNSLPCGKRELRKLRGVEIRSFLLETKALCFFHARDFDKTIPEELSLVNIKTLGDLLNAGYEKVRGCFVRARHRTFNPAWKVGEKMYGVSYHHLGAFISLIEILHGFDLELERKVVRGKKTKRNKTSKDPFDF